MPQVERQRVANDGLRVGDAEGVGHRRRLVVERLVGLEEPPDLAEHVRRQLRAVAVVGERRVVDADGDDLVVGALVVAHAHHADRARLDDRQREHRLLAQDQRVERVAVAAVAARNESVVGRVVHGAGENAIEPEEPRPLVELVLVLAALRDLDDDREAFGDRRFVDRNVVPRMHRANDQSIESASMATLGIVGGIGPESTIEYYRTIIRAYQERHGAQTQPSIVINSVDAHDMLGLFGAGKIPEAIDFLVGAVQPLADARATLGLIEANTPHVVLDRAQERSPIPLASIVTATRDFVRAAGWQRPALFGTKFTMGGHFYQQVFSRAGIEIVLPGDADQAYIHDKYMTELVRSQFLDATRDGLTAIVARMKDTDGIDAVILGGTELPLVLRGPEAAGVPLVDTTQVHARAAVDRLWP